MVQENGTIGLAAFRSFHAAARLGGISAAAERLNIAKSGVSRHVAQLEAHFGVRLFERGARSVKLTEVGARLDARIQSILAEVDLLGDIALEESAGLSGRVTMATTPEIGCLLAAKFLPLMRREHPNLNLVLRTQYAYEDLQDAGTDIAFRVRTSKDDSLVTCKMGFFLCFLVAAPEVAAAHPVAIPEDLSSAPCVTFRDDQPGSTWTLFREGTKTPVDVSGQVASRNFTVLRELAIAGEGYALLPEFLVEGALDRGELVRCLPQCVSREYPVFLTFRPGARQVARVSAAISAAETVVPSLFRGSADT